jgi:small subunit ribosomal protein S16
MATVVRLTRMGRRKKPFYRIVVTDSRKRRDGGWIESIGYYDPNPETPIVKFDSERIDYWKSVGAKLSDRVALITQADFLEKSKELKAEKKVKQAEKKAQEKAEA